MNPKTGDILAIYSEFKYIDVTRAVGSYYHIW